MNRAKAMKWVKALRSGRFNQTKEKLCKVGDNGKVGHCCLGVLAELNGSYRSDLTEYDLLTNEMEANCTLGSDNGCPRDKTGDAIPIKLRVGNKLQTFEDLAEANDRGASFKSIATWIEKNYKLL